MLLASCAKPIVRTETVTVHTPVYIALPADLLRPCVVDVPTTWTNGSLAEYAIQLRTCLNVVNDQLSRIQKLQPTVSAQP